MYVVTNLIVPSSGLIGAPELTDEFILNFCGFSISVDFDLKSKNIILLPHHQNVSILEKMNTPNDSYLVIQAGERCILEGCEISAFKGDYLLNKEKEKSNCNTNSFFQVEQLAFGEYEFTNKINKDSFIFKELRYSFIAERLSFLYFINQKLPSSLLRFDFELKLLNQHDFDGQGPGFSRKILGKYLFYVLCGPNLYLEVFDLDKFEVVSRKIEVEETLLEVYLFDHIYHIFVSGDLFLWDGGDLVIHEFNRKIIGYSVKSDFIYIGFEGESFVYAYQPISMELIQKKQITIDGYEPRYFAKIGKHNVIVADNSSQRYSSRQSYLAAWHDDDFFSEKNWQVSQETQLFTKTKVQEDELFSISLTIDSNHNYIKVIRHSMAIIEDVINKHGIRGSVERSSGYSKGFNGKINVQFEHSSLLNKEERSHLTLAIDRMHSNYAITDAGFANGARLPLIISVGFSD